MAVMRERNLRFAAVMIGFAGIVLLTVREDVLGPFLAPLTSWTAQATRAVLHVLGMEATRTGTVIAHPEGFAYDISTRCTGVVPVAFLTQPVAMGDGDLPRRRPGVGIGEGRVVPVIIVGASPYLHLQLRKRERFRIDSYHLHVRYRADAAAPVHRIRRQAVMIAGQDDNMQAGVAQHPCDVIQEGYGNAVVVEDVAGEDEDVR